MSNKVALLKKIAQVADDLDAVGYEKEAQALSGIMVRLSQNLSKADQAALDIIGFVSSAGTYLERAENYIRQNTNRALEVPGAKDLLYKMERFHEELQKFKKVNNPKMGVGTKAKSSIDGVAPGTSILDMANQQAEKSQQILNRGF